MLLGARYGDVDGTVRAGRPRAAWTRCLEIIYKYYTKIRQHCCILGAGTYLQGVNQTALTDALPCLSALEAGLSEAVKEVR